MKRESAWGSVAKVSMAIVGFVTLLALSNILSPPEFGIYVFLIAVGSLFAAVIDGSGEAVKKRASENGFDLSELYSIGFCIWLGWVGIFTFIILGASFIVGRLTFLQAVGVLAIVIGKGLFTIITSFVSGIGHISLSFRHRFFKKVFTLIFTVPIAFFVGKAAFVAVGFAMADLSSAGWLVMKSWRTLKKPTKNTIQSLTEFAKYSIVNKVLLTSNNRVPYILLGVIASSTLVGFYEVSWKLLAPALMVPFVVNEVLSVRATQQKEKGYDALDEMKMSMAFTLILSIPLVAGGSVLSTQLIVNFFGEQYKKASVILPILALVVVFRGLIIIFEAYNRGTNNPQYVTRVTTVRLFIKAVLLTIGVIYFGLVGAAVAILASEVVGYMLYLFETPVKPPLSITLIIISSAIVMAGVILILPIQIQSLIETLFAVGLGGIIYITLVTGSLYLFDREMYHRILNILTD